MTTPELEKEIEDLRLEISKTARKIHSAHREGDVVSFHLFLGMIVGQSLRLYEANAKAEGR